MMGFNQTLMRHGYLALNLPEFTRERLERAGLVISVAPSREFTASERAIVRDFVKGGGIFICTVGYDERGPSESLLRDFGFKIGLPPEVSDGPDDEPQPMSHFKVPYLRTRGVGGAPGQQAFVRYHASWPIWCNADPEEVRVIAYGRRVRKKDIPVIMFRRVGKRNGKFVVIGDTCFVMNKNLERRDGLPVEGKRENADFWRWFMTVLRDQPPWNPLKPPKPPAKAPPVVAPPVTTQPVVVPPARIAPAATQPAGGVVSGKGVRK